MPDTRRLLELALKGLAAELAHIDEEITQVTTQLRGDGAFVDTVPTMQKRTMSAAARKRISEGMKRRYAALRKTVQSNQVRTTPTRATNQAVGGLTAAGRKKLSEAAKRRWAANRKTGKTTL
jgi:hypothetical protein